MTRALLVVPHFYDPVCVPLGISSLKAYAERAGHSVTLLDLNTVPRIFGAQRAYYDEGKRQFPWWEDWYIERNGFELLPHHMLMWLEARRRDDYRELVAEVINLDERPIEEILDRLDVERFDAIFAQLYADVGATLDKALDAVRPDVVGCTLLLPTWPGALYTLRHAKHRMPEVRTVLGGPGVAFSLEEMERFVGAHDAVDYFVVGEGENAFLEILEKPDLPRGIHDPLAGLKVDEAKARSLRLGELPFPDPTGLRIPGYLLLSASSSRGCPFECSFCAETMYWKGFRPQKHGHVFDQLDRLATAHNRGSFFICDSLSNHIVSPLTADIAASGKPYKIDCYLRADEICTKPERTRKWREGGLFRARMGLESASQRILDAMVKMTNPERISRSLHALASEGVMTSTLWIINYPGETDAEFSDTLKFIRDNKDWIYQADGQVFGFMPYGVADSDPDDLGGEREDHLLASRPRFSDAVNDVLHVEPKLVQGDSRKRAYERLTEFVRKLREFGVPNPYRLDEWVQAEARWRDMGRESGWNPRASLQPLEVSSGRW